MAVLVLSFALSGCFVVPMTKYYSFSTAEVASVQFYDFRHTMEPVFSGFHDECDPVYTLPAKDEAAFLADFSQLEFSDEIVITIMAVDPSFCYGEWVIRINFENGRYAFFSSYGYGETFDDRGELISSNHFGCGDVELEQLIDRYYDLGLTNI